MCGRRCEQGEILLSGQPLRGHEGRCHITGGNLRGVRAVRRLVEVFGEAAEVLRSDLHLADLKCRNQYFACAELFDLRGVTACHKYLEIHLRDQVGFGEIGGCDHPLRAFGIPLGVGAARGKQEHGDNRGGRGTPARGAHVPAASIIG